MLRGSLLDIGVATAIQVAALTLITAGYAGFLLAPVGWPLRLLMGIAGPRRRLRACARPDLSRLAIGVGVLGASQHSNGRPDERLPANGERPHDDRTQPADARRRAGHRIAGAGADGGARADAGLGASQGQRGLRRASRRARLRRRRTAAASTRASTADICRAIAAAVFGDPSKVRFVVSSSAARLPMLQSGQIDVLPRTTTWTQTRDTANGLNFTAVTFYDGQGFLVRRSSGVARAEPARRRLDLRHLRHDERAEPGGLGAQQPHQLPPRGVRAERRDAHRLRGRALRRLLDRCVAAGRRAERAAPAGRPHRPARHHLEGAAGPRGAARRRPVVRHRALDDLRADRGRGIRRHAGQCGRDAAKRAAGDPPPARRQRRPWALHGARPALGLQRHQGAWAITARSSSGTSAAIRRSGCRGA